MSTGSCPSGSYGGHLRFGNGLVRIGSGDVGNAIGGVGAAPAVCGIIFSSTDEKVVMQNLNDRLASYIDKVRCLEAGNAELESKISDFYAKQGPPGERKDYSHYYRQMEELKNQIISTTVEINKILLKIDNNQLDVEDMRQKLECECSIRQNVEADLNGLHLILTQLTSSVTDLEAKRESLEEELCHLKKTHAEEVNRLQKWTSDVTVQVSTTPGPDLKRLLEEMRHKYEAMINSNRKEVVQWYESKLEEVNQKVYTRSKEAEDGRRKVVDLRRQLQAFEIDLQTQCNLKDSLQVSLAEIEHCYNTQLAEIQDHISCMEQQLTELRLEMEDQDQDYKELLDVKTRLEQEIQTYRSLLEGGQPDHVCVSKGFKYQLIHWKPSIVLASVDVVKFFQTNCST
ncbi:keratin, type I cytoskeletal 19-like [Tiliqua scincoides]|uniref:keratin, type I cytoskeletal 19-like n=1 Tax=Tiliqua scincoides TaxID=71010 RepID=UPI00346282F7